MNKTANHIDYIELPASSVDELKKVKAFFGEVFGWSFQQWGDDYADTKDSGIGSGISADSPTAAPLPVVRVADIQATYDSIKSAGGIITKDIFSFPLGMKNIHP